MINKLLLFIASILPIIWGFIHLLPTKSVVKGFGDISIDNKRIITMEWITEGVALMFIGCVDLLITIFNGQTVLSTCIYIASIVVLNVLSVVSIGTGFKVKFLPYRLCPFIFTGSSILLFFGILK